MVTSPQHTSSVSRTDGSYLSTGGGDCGLISAGELAEPIVSGDEINSDFWMQYVYRTRVQAQMALMAGFPLDRQSIRKLGIDVGICLTQAAPPVEGSPCYSELGFAAARFDVFPS